MRFQHNPFTDRLDISGQGPGGTSTQFVTGNDLVAVPADAGFNINIVGENVQGINTTGDAGTSTLTIAGINASTVQKGVLATATNPEAAAQSSTSKALTPSNISSLFSSTPLPVNQGGTGATGYFDGQLLIGKTIGNTLVTNTLTAGPGIGIANGSGNITISATGVITPDQLQIYYVGKNGNDANSGLNIESSKLTIGAAITTATALTPSATNRFVISIADDGIYTENITLIPFIDLFAPNATLTGTMTVDDNCNVKLFTLNAATGTTAITKPAGSTYSNVEVEIINLVGTANGCTLSTGFLNLTWKQLFVVNGYGIGDISVGLGHIHVKGGDIYISGTGIGLIRANTGTTVGRVDHILDIGGGTGSAMIVFDGTIDVSVSKIEVSNAYQVQGATSVLRLFANEIIGTRSSSLGGTAHVWIPPLYGLAGQILQSSGEGVDPLYTTATYPATTAQGDLLLSATLNTITPLNKNTTATRYLANTGANNNAQWDQINLANGVTGTLLPASGGTGLSSPAAHSLIVTEGASAYTALGVATNGQLVIGSTGADPVLALPTNGNNISWTGGAGTLAANLTGTTNHNIQIGNAGGSLTSLGSATNGQIPIGSTGADPVLATITPGTNISITNAAGSITINATASLIPWTEETGASFNIVINNGYITNRGTLVTGTLPATAVQGSIVKIVNIGTGGAKIAQNAGQTIRRGTNSSTTGATGFIQSINKYTSVTLLCTIADTDFQVIDGDGGNWTIS